MPAQSLRLTIAAQLPNAKRLTPFVTRTHAPVRCCERAASSPHWRTRSEATSPPRLTGPPAAGDLGPPLAPLRAQSRSWRSSYCQGTAGRAHWRPDPSVPTLDEVRFQASSGRRHLAFARHADRGQRSPPPESPTIQPPARPPETGIPLGPRQPPSRG